MNTNGSLVASITLGILSISTSVLVVVTCLSRFYRCCQRGPLAIAGPESVTAAVVAKAAQNKQVLQKV